MLTISQKSSIYQYFRNSKILIKRVKNQKLLLRKVLCIHIKKVVRSHLFVHDQRDLVPQLVIELTHQCIHKAVILLPEDFPFPLFYNL